MPGVVTVRLPDGSTKELPTGSTTRDLASSIGKRLAAAAVAAVVDGVEVDLDTVLVDGVQVAVVTADSDDGRVVLRHSTAHVLAQAVLELWPGAQLRHRPGHRATASTTTSPCPAGPPSATTTSNASRPAMREIIGRGPALRPPGALPRRRPGPFADQPFKREIISGVGDDAALRRGGVGRHRAGCGGGDHLPQHRPVRRPVPWPPCAVDRPARPFQAAAGGRRLLARRREAGPAAAHLRHRLGVRGGARPSTCTGSRRPSAATTAGSGRSSTSSPSPTRSGPGLAVFHPKGGLIRRLMEDYSRSRHESGGYEFVNTPHITKAELFEISGHLRVVRRRHVPAHGARRRASSYYLKPMNCPFHILIFRSRAALLPRAAPAAVRVRHGLPLREVRRRARPDAGAGHDPGRRPHLLHPRADGRRARLAAHLRPGPAARLRARRLLPGALDQAGGRPSGVTRTGTRPPRPCGRRPAARASSW